MSAGLRDRAAARFAELQEAICAGVESLDGTASFREDPWDYAGGEGGGVTRVLAEGAVFEKGGVNVSAVAGTLAPRLAERLGTTPRPFFAAGVSLVLHPRSPRVPTAHMNVRYLETEGDDGRAWFGGGADLTPYYLERDDARHFHAVLRHACERHPAVADYPTFKRQCDEYFFLPHRGEARGVGGVFFDYLTGDLDATFAFVSDVGAAFLPAYAPIVERRRDEPWGEAERRWQLVRRGRYVEFNLVHDRGTAFGLETGGRTESILMSLPPLVRWDYDHAPEAGGREAELLEVLRAPVDWAGG